MAAIEPTAQGSPIDKAKAFVSHFDGGDCFLIKPMSDSSDPNAYMAVGRQLQPFQRFDLGYTNEVGAEPQLSLRLITPSECPALDLNSARNSRGRIDSAH